MLTFVGRRVLLRADLNVTFEPGTTNIADDSRIRATMPTIELLRRKGAAIIACSHLGRPRGRVVPEDAYRTRSPASISNSRC